MTTPQLTSPRAVACPKCRARTLTACKTTKKNSIQIVFMKGYHAERRQAFQAAKAEQTTPHTAPTKD